MKRRVLQHLENNFNALFLYIEHFKYIHQFYYEDETLDLTKITAQTGRKHAIRLMNCN